MRGGYHGALLLLIVFLFLSSLTGAAPEKDWQRDPYLRRIVEAQIAIKQTNFAAAERLLREAVAEAEGYDPDGKRLLGALDLLGFVYEQLGWLEEAAATYERKLEVAERRLGPEHPALGSTYVKLAHVYRDLGRYELAEPYYHRAIALLEKGGFEEQRVLVAALTGYAELLKKKHPIRSRLPGSEARELEKRAQVVGDALYPGRARQRRGKDIGVYLFVGIFGFYGLLVGFGGVRMLIRMFASRHWPTTEGTIINSEVIETKNQLPRYRLEMTYRYNVEGLGYTGEVLSFSTSHIIWRQEEARRQAARYVRGATVPVYYCPGNPSLATLQPGGPLASPLSGVLFGIAMVIVMFVVFSG